MGRKIGFPKIDKHTQRVIDSAVKAQKSLIGVNVINDKLDEIERTKNINQEPLDLKTSHKTTKHAAIKEIAKQICIGIIVTVLGGLILYLII